MKTIYKHCFAALAFLFCFGLVVNAQDRSNTSKSERLQLMELQQEATDAGAISKEANDALKALDQNEAPAVKNADSRTSVQASGFPQFRNTGDFDQDNQDYRDAKEIWISTHQEEYDAMSNKAQPAMSAEEELKLKEERMRISGRTAPPSNPTNK